MILAGKGHEPYQVLKDRVIHFDDREVAEAQALGYGVWETLVAVTSGIHGKGDWRGA